MEEYYYPGEPEDILEEFEVDPEVILDEADIEDLSQQYQAIFKQYADETLKNEKKEKLFSVDQVQDFILEEDKPYLVLLKLLYEQAAKATDYPWVLVPDLPQSDHIAVWENVETQQVFVGCRGTSPFNPSGWQDLADDIQITFGVQPMLETILRTGGESESSIAGYVGKAGNLDVCNTMFITAQGRNVMQAILKKGIAPNQIRIGGHSLGGRAAACLGTEFNVNRVILFNAAAPATNPLKTGLGPDRQIHYHIGGDLISSHSDSSVMRLVIVDNSSYGIYPTTLQAPMLMPPGEMRRTFPRISISKTIDFDLIGHHVLTNFLKSKPSKGTITVDEYDTMWVYWSTHFSQEWGKSLAIGIMSLGMMNMMLYYVAWNSPIPNSSRAKWLTRLNSFCGNWAPQHWGDAISCNGRKAWNRALWLILGPLVVPFFTVFYKIAFAAVGAAAAFNGVQAIMKTRETFQGGVSGSASVVEQSMKRPNTMNIPMSWSGTY